MKKQSEIGFSNYETDTMFIEVRWGTFIKNNRWEQKIKFCVSHNYPIHSIKVGNNSPEVKIDISKSERDCFCAGRWKGEKYNKKKYTYLSIGFLLKDKPKKRSLFNRLLNYFRGKRK